MNIMQLPTCDDHAVWPALEAVSQMSGDQLDRVLQLVIWMSNTPNITQADVSARVQCTLGGNRRFAALLVDAIEASRKPRLHAANEA